MTEQAQKQPLRLTKPQIDEMLLEARRAGACEKALRIIANLSPEQVVNHPGAPYWASSYACFVLKSRWPEAEDIILKDAWAASSYARYVLKSRWPEAEHIICKDAQAASSYACDVLKSPWPEAEDIISKDARALQWYKQNVLKRP